MRDFDLDDLKQRLRRFTAERDWDQFHSPKNLAMALAGEVGELLEHFQWLTEAESLNLANKQNEEVALEMADVLIYLVRMADKLDIDLLDACDRKLDINESKYPSDKVRGSNKKYDEYERSS